MNFSSLCGRTGARPSWARKPKAPTLRLFLERLEDRLLPSLTPNLLKDINVFGPGAAPPDLVAVGGTGCAEAPCSCGEQPRNDAQAACLATLLRLVPDFFLSPIAAPARLSL